MTSETKDEPQGVKRLRLSHAERSLLDAVPSAVAARLLTYLSTTELWQVEGVAKPLSDLIQRAHQQRTELVLDQTLATALSSPHKSGRLVQWLRHAYSPSRVVSVDMKGLGLVDAEFLAALVRVFPYVTTFGAGHVLPRGPVFPRLTRLVCYSARLDLAPFEKLTSLATGVDLVKLSQWERLGQLEQLAFSSDMDAKKLQTVLQRCIKLQRLSVAVWKADGDSEDVENEKLDRMFATIAVTRPNLTELFLMGDLDEGLATGCCGWPYLRALRDMRTYSCGLSKPAGRHVSYYIPKEVDVEMRKTLKAWTKLEALSIQGFGVPARWFETDVDAAPTMQMTWLSYQFRQTYDLALVARFHIRFPRVCTMLPVSIKFSLATAEVDWESCCERLWLCCQRRALHSATDAYDTKTADLMRFTLLLECKTLDVLVGLVPYLVAASSLSVTGSPDALVTGAFFRAFRAKDSHMLESMTLEGRLQCEPAELDELLFACRRLKSFTMGLTVAAAPPVCKIVHSAAAVIECLSGATAARCEYQRVIFSRGIHCL